MAVFNPQVPATQDPNYLNLPKEVSAPAADKSAAFTLSTIGDAIKGGVAFVDTAIKETINDKVREGVEFWRDTQTSALERIRSEQKAGLIPPAQSELIGGDDSADTVPSSLESGISRAETLGTARAQGASKINDTYYTMQLNSLAKTLHNQYPGYKDYIDERFSKIAGMDPANAYYRNLMEDINRNMKVVQSPEAKAAKLADWAIKNGIPDMRPYITQVQRGVPGAIEKMEDYINRWQADKNIYAAQERERNRGEWNRTDVARDARQSWNKEMSSTTANIINTPFAVTGMNEPITMSRLMSDNSKNKALNDEQWGGLLMQMQDRRNQLVKYGNTLYNSRDFQKNWNNREEMQKDLNSQLMVVDNMIDAIKNKDVGTMFENQRRIQSRQDDATMSALNGPAGGYFVTQGIVRKMGGDIAASELSRTVLTSDVSKSLKTTLGNMVSKSWTPDDVRKDGTIKAIYDDIKLLQDNGIEPNTRIYDRLFDNIDTLKNPKITDAIKQEVIQYMFNPKNWKLMDRFKTDAPDPNNPNRIVPGQQSIFVRLTNPDITDRVWQLTRSKPQLWSQYKDFVQTSFQTIFKNDLVELSRTTSPDVKIGWDSDNKQLVLKFSGVLNKPITTVDVNYRKDLERRVNSLNWRISNLNTVVSKEGGDVGATLINMYNDMGIVPENIENLLPQQIMQNIANSKKSNKQRMIESYK